MAKPAIVVNEIPISCSGRGLGERQTTVNAIVDIADASGWQPNWRGRQQQLGGDLDGLVPSVPMPEEPREGRHGENGSYHVGQILIGARQD